MGILISTVRIYRFRGIENIEIDLDKSTVLTGMNNSGKTSFLKALQVVFGNKNFLSTDDFNIKNKILAEKIIIDVLIKPANGEDFSEDWEILFTTDRIRYDQDANSFIPLRTVVTYDPIKNSYKTEQFIQNEWPKYESEGSYWYEQVNGNPTIFYFDEIPFFYVNAQRDIIEDTKLKNSYLGKMLSRIEYSEEDIKEIENGIEGLNQKAVDSSTILTSIKASLKGLDTAMSSRGSGIEITPFTKKIRDLNKGMTIYYSDTDESFSMEYHGMGTRSWSSLLTLKAFISLLENNSKKEERVFFPILAIEEPESHLHPNAQKKLYRQMNEICGQKIISTHSPYIAACADLKQIRNFYKAQELCVGSAAFISLNNEELRKINRQVINTRGEIFFSKFIVFFEGETEEQALPILFEKYFGMNPVEAGVDFIGVGGYEGYSPFLNFAKQFNIPNIILSDADNVNITNKVTAQHKKVYGDESTESKVIFLDAGNDYEKQLVTDGFQDEIRCAILSLKVYTNEKHKEVQMPCDEATVAAMDDDALYKSMYTAKTQMAPTVAEQIVKSDKGLPDTVANVFKFIMETLKREGSLSNEELN
ncbi:AAA family ATPase [Proteus terrae]|uniref:AAA family ATPase n=1 Tax=Proteus terrae TaxID=1574161 RepID=UPI003C2D4D59